MTADVCRCGKLLQAHQDADLNPRPAGLCCVFVSEDEPVQLTIVVAAEPPVKEAA